MLNLIKADLYKSFHRLFLYVFLTVVAAALLIFIGVLASLHAPLENCIGAMPTFLMLPPYIICIFADMVMAEENREHTLKNTVSFGISRTKIYVSKTISTMLVGFTVAAVSTFVYLASALMLLRPQGGDLGQAFANFGIRLSAAMSIYIALAVLGVSLATVVKRSVLFLLLYYSVLLVPPGLLKLLNQSNLFFGRILDITLFMQAQTVAKVPYARLPETVWDAVAHLVFFAALGVLIFRKQDIE